MLDKKQIVARIKSIGKISATLQDSIHEVACSIVGHALQHGDVTLADSLVQAMGKGTRHQAIVTWLETFGPFTFKKNEDGSHSFALNRKKRAEFDGRAPNEVVESLLAGETWYDYTKESVKSIYDVEKMVANVINAAAAKVKKGEQILGSELVSDLSEVLLRHKLKKIEQRKEGQAIAVQEAAKSGLKVAA